jgi:hypothetical protein
MRNKEGEAMKRFAWLAMGFLLPGLGTGCVTRRMLITTDPPGALVYKEGQPLGPTPVDVPFIYYGKYRFQFVRDGYQTMEVEVDVDPPWYEWPGLEFISENFIPYVFHDVHPFHFQLTPLVPVRHDDVRNAGEQLRLRGQAINPRLPRELINPAVVPAPQVPPPPPAPPPTPLGPVGVSPAAAPASSPTSSPASSSPPSAALGRPISPPAGRSP